MKKSIAIALALVSMSGCNGADTNDALQTVAYMTFGLEEGEIFKKASDNPLLYKSKNFDVSVSQKDSCNYDFVLMAREGNLNAELPFSVDFTNVQSVSRVPSGFGMGQPAFATQMDGGVMSCGTAVYGPRCGQFEDTKRFPFTYADAERQQKAFQHFRAEICQG